MILMVKHIYEKFCIVEMAEEFMGSLLGRKPRVGAFFFFFVWSHEPAARNINLTQVPDPELDPGHVAVWHKACRQRRRQTHGQWQNYALWYWHAVWVMMA